MARPSDYKEEYNEQARKLTLLGATDKELADFFDVTERTINNWKESKDGFFHSLKQGKLLADSDVAQSLYDKAIGGDTTACIFWLKNRRQQSWRDKQEVVQDVNVTSGSDTLREALDAALKADA